MPSLASSFAEEAPVEKAPVTEENSSNDSDKEEK